MNPRKEEKAAYYRENKEHINARNKAWYEKNKEKRAAKKKAWRQANADKVNAHAAKHRASKIQRTPSWANLNEIKLIYKQAASLSKLLKTPLHVDHIVPLQGNNVSGLHVANNLQIMSAKDNMSKSNTWVA